MYMPAGHQQQQSAVIQDTFGNFNGGTYRIDHRDCNTLLTIQLAQGCPIQAKPGAMVAMSPSVTLKGQVKFSLKKMFTGGEMSVSTFTGPGEVLLAPAALGDIVPIQLDGTQQWKLGRGGFLACTEGVVKESKTQGFGKAMFSGEGLFLYKISGHGILFVTSLGAIVQKNLAPGESYIVDNDRTSQQQSTSDSGTANLVTKNRYCGLCKRTIQENDEHIDIACGCRYHKTHYERWLQRNPMQKCPKHLMKVIEDFECIFCEQFIDKDLDPEWQILECHHKAHSKCYVDWIGDETKFVCPFCHEPAKEKCFHCNKIMGYGIFVMKCDCGIDSHPDELAESVSENDGLCPNCNQMYPTYCLLCDQMFIIGDLQNSIFLNCCGARFHKAHLDFYLENVEKKCPRCQCCLGPNYSISGGGFFFDHNFAAALNEILPAVTKSSPCFNCGHDKFTQKLNCEHFACIYCFFVLGYNDNNSQKLCCDCQEKEPGEKYSFERTVRKIGGIPKEKSLLLKYREPNYTYSNSLKQCAICFDTTNHVSPFNCNKRCPICLDAFKLNSFISSSHCGILFHRHCISKWLQQCGICPICKKNVDEDFIFNERKIKVLSKRKLLTLEFREPKYEGHYDDRCQVCYSKNHLNPLDCDTRCPICMHRLKYEDKLTESLCNSIFHYRCIRERLSQCQICPVCKKNASDDFIFWDDD